MVRTKEVNLKKLQLLKLYLNCYYSLTFLINKGKDWDYSKLHLERNMRTSKNAEWSPPSVNLKILRHALMNCCSVILVVDKTSDYEKTN